MKQKLITLLLLLGMAVPIVAACGMVEPPIGETTTGSIQLLETTAPNATTSPIETTTERLPDITETTTVNSLTETTTAETANTITLVPTVNPLENQFSVSYRQLTTLVPCENGIAVLANRKLRYYDIAREKIYLLCSDPLCEHIEGSKDCISEFFGYNRTLSFYTSNMVYCENNGRFYLPRGEQFYSFAMDGSDLQLEYSFGNIGNEDQIRYQNTSLISLAVYKNYIYFIHNGKNKNALYVFDTDTGELTHLHEDKDVVWCVIVDDMLMYAYRDDIGEFHVAVSDVAGMLNNTRDSLDVTFVENAIYHDGIIYSLEDKEIEGSDRLQKMIVSYDPKTGQRKTLSGEIDGGSELLAVTDRMIYYRGFSDTMISCIPIEGGTAKVAFAETSWHRDHTVYRAPHEGNSADTFRPEDIYFISEDQVVIGGVDSEYTPMYLADVKDDGTFTNIRKVEMKGDRYVPAEPIEKAEITPAQPQVSDYLDDFVEFHYFTNGSIRRSKDFAYDNMFAGKLAIQFRVLGIDHTEEKNATYYKVQLLHVYGDDTTVYDMEKTYIVKYGGTPECPYYNRPALELGKDYLMAVSHGFEKKESISNTWIYSLSYENGKTYAYSTNYDLCGLICAEKITDPEENQIFKPDIHAKYIAAANERGLGLETYDYKCELYALLAEVWEIE